MKKHFCLLIGGILLAGSLLFVACQPDSEEPGEDTYSVITETYLRADSNSDTPSTEVGTITANPSGGPKDTLVTVTIASNPGYYIEEVFIGDVSSGKNTSVSFTLLDKDVTVKAIFKAQPPNTYKVTLTQPDGGIISFTIDGAGGNEFGPPGSTVTLSNNSTDGYLFKEYTAKDADNNPVTITGGTFTLPAKDVTVSGVFEKIADIPVDQLLATGKDALEAGNLAAAINAYEAAYTRDSNNTEALVYSAIGKLASVVTSGEVENFFKNRLGLKDYPDTLDALIDPAGWFEYYPNKDRTNYYYDSALGKYLSWQSRDWYSSEYFDKTFTEGDGYYYQGPYTFVSATPQYPDWDTEKENPLSWYQDKDGNSITWRDQKNYSSWSEAEFAEYYPNGNGYYYNERPYVFVTNVPYHNPSGRPPLNVPEWVKTKEPYTDSLVTIDGETVASSAAWPIILIANLIDGNSTGLNPALDDAINAVFNNPDYTAAEARTASLKGKDPVKLDADIVQKFGLSEFFGDTDAYIGWTELELLLSALKLVKATLLYVDSYNWDYDIGFVKDLDWDESVLNEDKIDALAANRNKVLPLRTGFMTNRGGTYMEQSRTAYVEALTSIIGVYDYYIGADSKIPAGYKDTLKEYEEYRQDVVNAKNAIEAKGPFTVPEEVSGDRELTIDFGKFFTPGQLALENLIETEGSGSTKAPVFYGHTRNPDGTLGTLTKIGSSGDLEKYEGIALKFKISPIGEIIGQDFARNLLEGSGFAEFSGDDPVIVFDPMFAAIAWIAYHWGEEGVEEYFHEKFGSGE
ncbi:MAG: hypothetical protein LBF77_05215 [Spirochaetaceae bacterium]|jgi:hypothetical protein|nr:hypothetical protein [Spirochaetaceae bacterium]